MGKVFEKDGSMYQAIDWWKKGVEQSENNSQAALGAAYFTGKGASLKKKKGLELLQKAAKQGNQKAIQLLAAQ
jgi:TPR repeat protein